MEATARAPLLLIFAKATLRHGPGLSLRRLVDRRGRLTSRWKREYAADAPRIPHSVTANIHRGRVAMAHVIATHTNARNAMFRSDLGWIDFVWGSPGGAAAKSGKRKGARGVAHILESRQRKDGMKQQAAERLAMLLPEVIARGRVARSDSYGDKRRIVVAFAGHEAVLVQQRRSNAWLLSGWRKEPR